MTHFTITFSPLPKYLFEEERSSTATHPNQLPVGSVERPSGEGKAGSGSVPSQEISNFSAESLVRSVTDSLREKSAGPSSTGQAEKSRAVKLENVSDYGSFM